MRRTENRTDKCCLKRFRSALALSRVSVALLVGLSSGCQHQALVHVSGRGQFQSVFEGFIYVGRDIDRGAHYSPGFTLPAQLTAGHTYTFHHERPFDGGVFAREILPQRLQQIEFSITKPVDSGQPPYVLEPATIWSVKFARRGCTGILYTSVCEDLVSRRIFTDSRLHEEDYNVRLEGDCGDWGDPRMQTERKQ